MVNGFREDAAGESNVNVMVVRGDGVVVENYLFSGKDYAVSKQSEQKMLNIIKARNETPTGEELDSGVYRFADGSRVVISYPKTNGNEQDTKTKLIATINQGRPVECRNILDEFKGHVAARRVLDVLMDRRCEVTIPWLHEFLS